MTCSIPFRELSPAWVENDEGKYALIFKCPVCERGHSIAVPYRDCSEARDLTHKGSIWSLSPEDFNTCSVHPSIDLDWGQGCTFHGWIKGGQVVW